MAFFTGTGTTSSGNPIDVVDADAAAITGGAIDNTTIGATTPAAGTFTTLATSSPVTDLQFTSYSETVYTDAAATGAVSIDYDNGPYQVFTLTGNVTFSLINPAATGYVSSVTLELIQDATGSRTVTWPTMEWANNGTAPTLTTSANTVSIVTIWTRDGGTTYRGALVGDDFA